jgi:hypothetical protein
LTYPLQKEKEVYKQYTENEAATETLGELMRCFKVSIKVLQRHSLIEEYKKEVSSLLKNEPIVTPNETYDSKQESYI